MNKMKMIFTQTLMISTAILLGLGLQALASFLTAPENSSTLWPWYMPLSIILAGFLCSLPTLFIENMENLNSGTMKMRIVLHFLSVLVVVSLCGLLFNWYENIKEYMIIFIMYVLIYAFVWAATFWIGKADENKINEAIKAIRDEE